MQPLSSSSGDGETCVNCRIVNLYSVRVLEPNDLSSGNLSSAALDMPIFKIGMSI